MPSTTPKQQRFMFAELAKAKKGQPTKTHMSIDQLEDFTHLSAKSQADHLEKRKR